MREPSPKPRGQPRLEPKPVDTHPPISPETIMLYTNAAYFANAKLYEGKTPANSIEPGCVSHIYYGFAYAYPNGDVVLSDQYADDQRPVDGVAGGIRACTNLRGQNPSLKVVLSVHAPNENFVQIARDPAAREVFGRSARRLVDSYDLDGVDICWIFPRSKTDGAYYTDLLANLRRFLPGPRYSLSSGWPGHELSLQYLSITDAAIYLDFINLMAYDYASPYHRFAGHHAQLYARQDARLPFCGNSAVDHLLKNRVPGRKILLGVPTYGRGFLDVSGPGDEYKRMAGRNGFFEYYELPGPGVKEDVDTAACAAYCFFNGSWITYDNPDTVSMKSDFVKTNKLGGLFYSESTSDANGPRSLIRNGYCRLHGE